MIFAYIRRKGALIYLNQIIFLKTANNNNLILHEN